MSIFHMSVFHMGSGSEQNISAPPFEYVMK